MLFVYLRLSVFIEYNNVPIIAGNNMFYNHFKKVIYFTKIKSKYLRLIFKYSVCDFWNHIIPLFVILGNEKT